MNAPRPVQPTTNLTAWLSKAQRYMVSNTNRRGKDILTSNGPNGSSSRKMEEIYAQWGMRYDFDLYDPDKSYQAGKMVQSDKTILCGYNANEDDSGYDINLPIYSYPGVYVCVANVPAYLTDVQKSEIRANLPSDRRAIFDDMVRKDNWIYAPVFPAPAFDIDTFPNAGFDYRYALNQYRFWEFIGYMPQLKSECVDGETIEIYVQCALPPSVTNAPITNAKTGPGIHLV